MKIPITKPFFDSAEEKAVIAVLRSGWVTQGPKVAELEEAICKLTGAKYAVATTSATTGLFLSLYLLEIGPGDEVIVPSFSFIATANVVVHVGATPVFADIDLNTYNIDPKKIEEKITKKTRAIIPVHQVGLPCDLDPILKIAKKHNLLVIEDGACALGSKYKNKMVGNLGPITAFSFHPRKAVTTGEGGMITTNNASWAKKLKILRHHGMSVSDVARHKAKKIIKEKYEVIGFNFRMSDIQAAVGLAQLKKLPGILKKRTALAQKYNKSFKDNPNLAIPAVSAGFVTNWQSYILRLKKSSKISRDDLMQKLIDLGISTKIGIMASHLEPVYQKMHGNIFLPNTEEAYEQTITIPLFPKMTVKEQDYIIKKIWELTT